ncbi:MAG: hypothetical protein K9N49_02760 [Candidatus Marinimicrobia bacterium]|nr:hypothetical protein [Candidatus Neomarinimicrobiota bacterium]
MDAEGQLVFQVLRYPGKDFRQRRPDPAKAGGWVWDMKGVHRVLYHLPAVMAAKAEGGPIFITEGEKDAEALTALGFTATCNAGGACKWESQYTEALAGAAVILVPDKDDAGKRHSDRVQQALLGTAKSLKVVWLPEREGRFIKDSADWVAAGGTAEEMQALCENAPEVGGLLPEVVLPGGSQRVVDSAAILGKIFGGKQRIFMMNGKIVRARPDRSRIWQVEKAEPVQLVSEFEEVAALKKPGRDGELVPTICSKAQAEFIAAAAVFRDALSVIKAVSNCPVLTESGGELTVVNGQYDPDSGVLAAGIDLLPMALDEAVYHLKYLLAEFDFVSDGDRARALTGLITPAFVRGWLLDGRAPMDLGTADNSQGGKGFRHKVTAAVYNDTVNTVTKKERGVGSIEEAFDQAILSGANFVSLDNVRGPVDLECVESFLTEDTYNARVAYSPNQLVSDCRTSVMMTSNNAELTRDLANRTSVVAIRKRPDDYQFRTFPEGDLLAHVRANTSLYLGAVFTVIQEWHAQGKPKLKKTAHDFRAWGTTLGWISENLLDAGPLLEDYKKIQWQLSNPGMIWLREVALAVCQAGRDNEWLRAAHLIPIMADAGVSIPGLAAGGSIEHEASMSKALCQVGRKLGGCFGKEPEITIEDMRIERRVEHDKVDGKEIKEYRFTSPSRPGGPSTDETADGSHPDNPEPEPPGSPPGGRSPIEAPGTDVIGDPSGVMGGEQPAGTVGQVASTDTGPESPIGSPNKPPIKSPIKELNSPIPPIKKGETPCNAKMLPCQGPVSISGEFGHSMGDMGDMGESVAQQVLNRPRLVLDFETYFDAQYSLEQLSTLDYVLDERFQAHGLAIRHPDGRTEFREDIEACLGELRAQYGAHLERVVTVCHNAAFDYFVLWHRYGMHVDLLADTMLMSRLVYSPHVKHGLANVAQRLGLDPKGSLDFMKGVRQPSPEEFERLRNYALRDVEITEGIAAALLPRCAPAAQELWAMDHAVRTFVERPLAVDAAALETARSTYELGLKGVIQATGVSETVIRSTVEFPALLGNALAATGRTLPMKPGKRGPIAAISRKDPAHDEFLRDDDPAVRSLMGAKKALGQAAAHRKRFDYLANAAGRMQGYCPVFHGYHGAGTGRYTGGEGFNIQNLKKSGQETGSLDVAHELRRSLQAPPGNQLVAADASQIEARIIAWLAGQEDLHRAFADGTDVYSEFAAKHLHREVRKPRAGDSPEVATELSRFRQIGKQAILGLGYGMGVSTFIEKLKESPSLRPLFDDGTLSNSVCAAIVYGYREQYERLTQFWGAAEEAAKSACETGGGSTHGITFEAVDGSLRIVLPSGRALVYPGIYLTEPETRSQRYIDRDGEEKVAEITSSRLVYAGKKGATDLYGGKLVENITQAYARDLLISAMQRAEADGYPVVAHCHDSITVLAKESQVEAAKSCLIDAWQTTPSWANGLILDAEAEAGISLADV